MAVFYMLESVGRFVKGCIYESTPTEMFKDLRSASGESSFSDMQGYCVELEISTQMRPKATYEISRIYQSDGRIRSPKKRQYEEIDEEEVDEVDEEEVEDDDDSEEVEEDASGLTAEEVKD